jgi:hypothetical protein
VTDPTDEDIERILRSADRERWRNLAAAADALAADTEATQWEGGQQIGTTGEPGAEQPVLRMPYPIYSRAVDGIADALRGIGAVVPFNWPDWDGIERYRNGRRLEAAPVADAVRMATVIIRAERFSDGTIGEMVENGTLPAVVARLRRWAAEELGVVG